MDKTTKTNIASITVGTLTILLNILEITFILKKWRKIKPYEQLLLNLAIADFLVGGVWCGAVGYQMFNPRWIEETDLAFFIIGSIRFSIFSSGMNISAISIDRLVAIKFPLRHRLWMSKRNARIINAVTWTLIIICTITYTMLTHYYTELKYYLAAAKILSYGLFMIILNIFLMKEILSKPDNVIKTEQIRIHQQRRWERKVILICGLFVASYIICTWPTCFELLLKKGTDTSFAAVTLIFVNSLIDPCLYFFKDFLRRNH